jgi:glucose/arabinose dehydrogenase
MKHKVQTAMKTLFALPGLLLGAGALQAQTPVQAPAESEYYSITPFATPAETALEVSSVELLPGRKVAVGTRRGEIWVVDGAYEADVSKARFQRFAEGQHEVMGLAWKDGYLYATNRYEVLRMKDEDGDGRADLFETVCDKWGVSGDYHEYTFSSRFDKAGDLWVVLCLTGSFSSKTDFRGWAVRIKPDGSMVPTCSGIRSPGGIGFDADGAVFYTDNQGPWHGSCTLQHLVPGSFQGHPGGFAWYDNAPNMGPRPLEPNDESRMVTERARVKELVPPAVYMAHGKVGNSSSFIVCDTSGGKFGPFQKQLFVADQSHSNISRVYLEDVNGVKQGVVFPFLKGFKSGLIGGRMNEEGQIFAGGSDRGWGAKGGQPYDFERVQWTGKVPFEVHEMRARPDGFELAFTEKVDAASAADLKNYSMREFTYIYQSKYGSPEVDEVIPKITSATVGADGKTVRIKVEPLTKGHIHELHLDGVRSAAGLPVLHPVGYYTLNEIPTK